MSSGCPVVSFEHENLHCPAQAGETAVMELAPTGASITMLLSRRAAVAGLSHPGARIDPPAQFATTWNCARSPRDMLRMNGPELTRIHQTIGVITVRNSPARLADLRDRAKRAARRLDPSGPAYLISQYCEKYIGEVVASDMGVPVSHWRPFILKPTNTVLGLRMTLKSPDAVTKAWAQIYKYVDRIIVQKIRRPDSSVVSRTVAALQAAGFSPDAIRGVIATYLTGYPTPVSVLAEAIAWLLSRPAMLAACLARPALFAVALNEALAVAGNFAYASPRLMTADVRLGPPTGPPLVIPAGTVVIPNVRRALWENTRKFTLAWGTGPHRCPFVWRSWEQLLTGLTEFCQAHPNAHLVRAGARIPGLLALPEVYDVAGLTNWS